ncbi:MAG: hypothetical protein NT094_04290 [Candidatus Staskawiczbacteria bacterium]|nr:hypothetical protein [Candidatus Staskawiczbacteria bacterium]
MDILNIKLYEEYGEALNELSNFLQSKIEDGNGMRELNFSEEDFETEVRLENNLNDARKKWLESINSNKK